MYSFTAQTIIKMVENWMLKHNKVVSDKEHIKQLQAYVQSDHQPKPGPMIGYTLLHHASF